MSELRCSECEALITDVECLDCVWNDRHQNAVRLSTTPATTTATHCRNGHAMTEANTRLENRAHCVARVCRICHSQRIAQSRAKQKALKLEGAQ